MTAAQATAAVSMVENKQRLTFADHAEISRLQGIIHTAATRDPRPGVRAPRRLSCPQFIINNHQLRADLKPPRSTTPKREA